MKLYFKDNTLETITKLEENKVTSFRKEMVDLILSLK